MGERARRRFIFGCTLQILGAACAATLLAVPGLSQTVTPVTPNTVVPVTPGTVTPVRPGPGQVVTGIQIRRIVPARLMWLRSNLKLREQPGRRGRAIGTIRAGTAVNVVGEVAGNVDGLRWYQVEVAGSHGFIAAIKLSSQPHS